jgi:hypothetical protein
MRYKDRLYPWCIIRHLPKSQNLVVGRLRRRNDAEDHLRVLQMLTPTASYSIIYDPLPEDSASVTAKSNQPTEKASSPL